MAMGTVPCLLWKWWTWWVVLREEETRAATAGHGKTSSARESTSLNRNAGLAHTTGDAALGLDTISNPPSTSTSTSCSIGVGPERIVRPLPLIRHTQEVNILNESWAHDPPAFQPGEERKIQNKNISQKKKKKKIPVWKSQKQLELKTEKKDKILPEMKEPQEFSNSLVLISKCVWLDPWEPQQLRLLSQNT